jgi:hypothetical protein
VFVTAADLDRDGLLDLVVVDQVMSALRVLLGNGDGTFRDGGAYQISRGPHSVAVGDFTGNGILDLAVTNSNSTVSILLGNGDGTFGSAHDYAAGPSPQSVAVGHFSGGVLDLVVANSNPSGVVSVLLGNGDGSFQDPRTFQTGSFPSAVAVGDVNADGQDDIVTANAGGTVSVLLGNGDGSFRQAIHYSAGSSPRALALGDFNDDGYTDVVVANANGNNVSVLLNAVDWGGAPHAPAPPVSKHSRGAGVLDPAMVGRVGATSPEGSRSRSATAVLPALDPERSGQAVADVEGFLAATVKHHRSGLSWWQIDAGRTVSGSGDDDF